MNCKNKAETQKKQKAKEALSRQKAYEGQQQNLQKQQM